VNPNAYWKLSKLDYYCGALAIGAITLWLLTDEPLVAIFFAIAADLLAGLPTLVKAWRHPETETAITFVFGAISALTTFAALKTGHLSEFAFSLYLVLICSSIAYGIYRGKPFFKKIIG